MEKTRNGRAHRQFVTAAPPRQTAAERRLKSFAIALEEFQCDKGGTLFNEAFQSIAPPKRPSTRNRTVSERSGMDVDNGPSVQIEPAAVRDDPAV
jgi:hypothetical protein